MAFRDHDGTDVAAEPRSQRTGALIAHLLLPQGVIRSRAWLDDRRLLAILIVGVLPLFLRVAFAQRGHMDVAVVGLAVYSALLWAAFFFYAFPAPNLSVQKAALCVAGTGLVSTALLLAVVRTPPMTWVSDLVRSEHALARLAGCLFGVSIPEEVCKALVLFLLVRQTVPAPQQMLFYGLMSGLGFAVYEAVDYQMGRNLSFSDTMGQYYILNMLRLTSLPFLHAIWTGTAAYFIGLAFHYPQHRRALLVVGLGVPAVLHAIYNFIADDLVAVVPALLSALALYLYRANSADLERTLAGTAAAAVDAVPTPIAATPAPLTPDR